MKRTAGEGSLAEGREDFTGFAEEKNEKE